MLKLKKKKHNKLQRELLRIYIMIYVYLFVRTVIPRKYKYI